MPCKVHDIVIRHHLYLLRCHHPVLLVEMRIAACASLFGISCHICKGRVVGNCQGSLRIQGCSRDSAPPWLPPWKATFFPSHSGRDVVKSTARMSDR